MNFPPIVPTQEVSRRQLTREAFTLVELLVVIGIIGLLVAILLPALQSARRQAMLVKCASNLRQCALAQQLYANTYKGYAVPPRAGGGTPTANPPSPSTSTAFRVPYELFGVLYGGPSDSAATVPPQTVNAAWWPEFLAKFLGTAKGGQGDWVSSSQTGQAGAVAAARNSVFWCPSWQAAVATNDNQPLYTGYAVNYMVSVTPRHPQSPFGTTPENFVGGTTPVTLNTNEWFNVELNYTIPGAYNPASGKWYKLSQISMPAQRCFMADATTLFLESWMSPNQTAVAAGQTVVPPPQGIPPAGGGSPYNGSNSGQNSFDCYRHGVYPGITSFNGGQAYDKAGGKVSYNILFFDGHVATSNDRADSYRSVRMRYPN